MAQVEPSSLSGLLEDFGCIDARRLPERPEVAWNTAHPSPRRPSPVARLGAPVVYPTRGAARIQVLP